MQTTVRLSRFTARLLLNGLLIVVMLASSAFILPSLFGYQRYAITGGSMSGTFEKGSLAFDKVVPVSELRTGDVITYRPPAETGLPGLVTHRLVEIRPAAEGTWFRTKGDANAAADPWKFQLEADTQPRLAFTVPFAGYAFLALADRNTRMVLIGIPAGLIAVLCLVEVVGIIGSPKVIVESAPSRLAAS